MRDVAYCGRRVVASPSVESLASPRSQRLSRDCVDHVGFPSQAFLASAATAPMIDRVGFVLQEAAVAMFTVLQRRE